MPIQDKTLIIHFQLRSDSRFDIVDYVSLSLIFIFYVHFAPCIVFNFAPCFVCNCDSYSPFLPLRPLLGIYLLLLYPFSVPNQDAYFFKSSSQPPFPSGICVLLLCNKRRFLSFPDVVNFFKYGIAILLKCFKWLIHNVFLYSMHYTYLLVFYNFTYYAI